MNRRIPILVIVISVLLAGFLVDRTTGTGDGDVATTSGVVDGSRLDLGAFAVSNSAQARSTTWFCAGGSADEEAFADHVVTVVNPSPNAQTVTLTVFGGQVAPSNGPVDLADTDSTTTTEAPSTTAAPEPVAPVTRELALEGRSRLRVRLADSVDTPVASALVESSGGGVVVEHEVVSTNGRDAKPCATQAAAQWHFAWGNTTVEARELLVVFNPFPADAIIDGSFSTEDGARQPARFDGLVIPGRSTMAVDLGDDVTRREEVAASIVARSGRVVVDRIVRINSDRTRGLTVQSGVTEPQRAWVYPDGLIGDTIREEFVVYNPSAELAEASISFALDDPETNGIPETIEVSLSPGTHQTVAITEDLGVPAGVAHTVTVRSANGVPLVSEQVQYAEGATRKGIAVTTGSPVEADQWTFAAGAADSENDEFLVLANLDQEVLAKVDVAAIAGGQLIPVADLQGIEIGPQQRLAIRLGEKIQRSDLALVVTSSEPIVAERGLYRVGDRGVSSSVGVPAADGMRLVPDPIDNELTVDLGTLEEAPTIDGDEAPAAPDDVELPEPDSTIVFDDPDAEADLPAESTTTTAPPAPTETTAPPG